MALWQKTSALLAAGLVAGVVSPVTPIAVAQVLAEKSTMVTHPCTLEKPISGGADQSTIVSPDDVLVRFPATVAPGQVFTAYVRPGAGTMQTTDGRGAGLLSYDIAFPSGTTNLGASNNGGGAGLSGTAHVDRVAANGNREEFGPFARISGRTTAYFGENSRNGTTADRWKAGLQVASNTEFQFPEVALRMRAPVTSGESTFSVALKGAGSSSGSSTNGAANTIQGGEKGAGWSVGLTNYFFCSSSANAASLSTTYVNGSLPRYIAQTSITLANSDAFLPNGGNRSILLEAQVSTSEELMSNVRGDGATVRFDMTNRTTGATSYVDAPIEPSGRASTQVTLAQPSGSNTREDYDVRATYTGRTGDIASSSSSTAKITSGYNERRVGVALSSTNGALSGGALPVTVKADVTSGSTFPSGLYLQLYRNEQPIGVPVAIPGGGTAKQIQFPTHTLTQGPQTQTYRYRAEVLPLITNNTLDRYSGASSIPVAAIVTGSDPSSPLPDGGQGSVSLEGFFRAPQLVWDWLTGSMGQTGTFSLGFGN